MDAEKIKKIVLETSVDKDGKKVLPCSKAFEIAEKHKIGLAAIGKCCNDNQVKIIACQLGCFQ